jgi:PhoPQ-activated pathogenicity-related protein
MTFPPHNWPHWLPPYHSNETERRLTEASKDIERLEEIIHLIANKNTALKKKLGIHERLFIATGAGFQILFQDKYPWLAQIIKQLLH